MRGTLERQLACADRQLRRRAAHQHRDRVLVLRPRDADVDLLRLRGEHQRLGGDDVGLGRRARVVLVLRDFERALVLLDGVGEQIVAASRTRAIAHRRAPAPTAPTSVALARSAALTCGRRALLLDRAPHLAPDVERPAAADLRRRAWSVDLRPGLARASSDGSKLSVGIKPGARLGDQRQRLAVIGFVGLQGLVGDGDLRLQPVELGVAKQPSTIRPWRSRRAAWRASSP